MQLCELTCPKCVGQASRPAKSWAEVTIAVQMLFFLPQGILNFASKALTDWVRPTKNSKNNLPYLKVSWPRPVVAQLVEHRPVNRTVWVRVLVRAHASVVSLFPGRGARTRGNPLIFLSHVDVCLSLYLPPFPSL